MFVMVFVEHILWGEIVFKGKRILVWLVYLSPSQYLKLGLMYGMVAVKHTFGLQENGWGAAETIFLESKSVFYSYHPIYGRKLDYGNNIHPCFQICALTADISGRNLQLWWSWPWCSSVFRALEVMREKIGQLGSDLHASFLQKFPGGESGKVFNFICLLAFSELCMYCPPNLPESLCSGWSNFESAWWVRVADWLGGVGN